MISLYGRLFTYRARESRSPLEDYLTEALADLLNRVPETVARDAVALLLKEAPGANDALARFWPAGARALWRTQAVIDQRKRVDLVMSVAGADLIAVESKIAAGFQHHEGPGTASPPVHQLSTYSGWIARNGPEGWGGATVLLTHWTPAPDGFLTDAQAFPCRYRSVGRWAALARLLDTAASSENHASWAILARELVGFMQEQKMTADLMTSTDIAGLNVFITMADRVQATIYDVWEKGSPVWKKFCQQRSYPIEYDSSHGCVWAYRYLKHPSVGPEGFLAFGVRFPEVAKLRRSMQHEKKPHVFVEIMDGGSSSIELGVGWALDASDDAWTASLPLADMPLEPELFAERALEWSLERYNELVATISDAPAA